MKHVYFVLYFEKKIEPNFIIVQFNENAKFIVETLINFLANVILA